MLRARPAAGPERAGRAHRPDRRSGRPGRAAARAAPSPTPHRVPCAAGIPHDRRRAPGGRRAWCRENGRGRDPSTVRARMVRTRIRHYTRHVRPWRRHGTCAPVALLAAYDRKYPSSDHGEPGCEADPWNRNGRELFYRSGDKMMVVDVATQPAFAAGKSCVLFEGQYKPIVFTASNDDVSPDGRRFLMIKRSELEAAAPTRSRSTRTWCDPHGSVAASRSMARRSRRWLSKRLTKSDSRRPPLARTTRTSAGQS